MAESLGSATLSCNRSPRLTGGRQQMKKLHTYDAGAVSFPVALSVAQRPVSAQTHTVQPVLAFPEAGLDDPAAYQGYQTRFFRAAKGNVVQIYLDARTRRASRR